MDDVAIIYRISKGERPARPHMCDDARTWKVITECWSQTPLERPLIDEVHRSLQYIVASEDTAHIGDSLPSVTSSPESSIGLGSNRTLTRASTADTLQLKTPPQSPQIRSVSFRTLLYALLMEVSAQEPISPGKFFTRHIRRLFSWDNNIPQSVNAPPVRVVLLTYATASHWKGSIGFGVDQCI